MRDSRSILGFMLDVKNQDDLSITLRLNGTKVWEWNYSGSSDLPVRYFQEVVANGIRRVRHERVQRSTRRLGRSTTSRSPTS